MVKSLFTFSYLNVILYYYFFFLETSNTDSDSKDSTEQSNFNETNDSNELDDTEIEPPVFDTTKENDYNIKYKQSFEEVTNLDDVYILDLDAQT